MGIVLGLLIAYCIVSTIVVVVLIKKVNKQKRLIRKRTKQLTLIKNTNKRKDVMLNKEIEIKDKIKEAYKQQLLALDNKINKLISMIDKLENDNILVHYKGKMLLVYPSRIAVDIDDIQAGQAYRSI